MWLESILALEIILTLYYIRASYMHKKYYYTQSNHINVLLRDMLVISLSSVYLLYDFLYYLNLSEESIYLLTNLCRVIAIFIFVYTEGHVFEVQKMEYWLLIYFGIGFSITIYLFRFIFQNYTFYLTEYLFVSQIQNIGVLIFVIIVSIHHLFATYKFKKQCHYDFISLFLINFAIFAFPSNDLLFNITPDIQLIKNLMVFILLIFVLPRVFNVELMTHIDLYMLSVSSKNGDFFYILNFLDSKINNEELVPFVASTFNALENFNTEKKLRMIYMRNYTIFSNSDKDVNIFLIINRPTRLIEQIVSELRSPKLIAVVKREIFKEDYQMQKFVIRSLIHKAFYPYSIIKIENDYIYRIQ